MGKEVQASDVREACKKREDFDHGMRNVGDLIRAGYVTPEEAGLMVEYMAHEYHDSPDKQWFAVMGGTTGNRYTDCKSLDEAWELARNNRALGFDAWVDWRRKEQ